MKPRDVLRSDGKTAMRRLHGFTLIEMAVAIFIITLLLGSILVPLQTQVEQRQIATTQKYLDDIKEALVGFAAANGRLPCPATATSSGVESFTGTVGASTCTTNYQGFVPASTLGITPLDDQGFAVDPWGNRIRYAVTAWTGALSTPAFTTTNGMSTLGLTALTQSSGPFLLVCASATGITTSPPSSASCGAATNVLTSSPGVPAVIYSIGKNGATGGTGVDEAANANPNSATNDNVFISHTPASSSAANGEFDDIVVWLSPNILYGRMIAAGRLP